MPEELEYYRTTASARTSDNFALIGSGRIIFPFERL
jgi:hypothetical protein